MDPFCDDRFLVFVRTDTRHDELPEANELPLAVCDSYEEARRIKSGAACNCVIRFGGYAGGGD
jgi:hypothetical protein